MLPLLMASALAFDAACPCIDRPESASVRAAGMWSDGLNCSLVTWPGAEPSKAIQCIPEAYGYGCGAHDSQLEPFCALPQSDPPAFCQQSWCWVNATECRSSAVTMARSQMFPDLHFSYATCASTDTWSAFHIERGLQGRVVRAAIPATWYPYAFGHDADGNVLPDWTPGPEIVGEPMGIFPEFMNAVAERAGFTFEYMTPTYGSRVAQGGSWEGCISDVGKGNLDICIQAMYVTPKREKLSLFTMPLDHDTAHMVIPTPKVDNSLGSEILKPFQPFDIQLWAAILAVTVLTGVVLTMLTGNKPVPSDGKSGAPGRSARALACMKSLPNNIYLSVFEIFANGGPMGDASDTSLSLPHRLTMLTWGFFILITLSAYTANLAAMLSRVNVKVPFRNVQECVDKRCAFCTTDHASTLEQLNIFYPTLSLRENKTVGEDDLWHALSTNTSYQQQVTGHTCDATWSYRFAGHRFGKMYNNVGGNFPCADVRVIDAPLFSLPLGLPVNTEMAAAMNHHILHLVNEGLWQELQRKYEPAQLCGDHRFDESSFSSDAASDGVMSVRTFAGPFLILAACLLMAVVASICNGSAFRKRTNVDVKTTLDANEVPQTLPQSTVIPA